MEKLLGFLPFLLMKPNSNGGKVFQVNWHKIAESVISGAIIAMFLWYVGFRELKKDVEYNTATIKSNRIERDKQNDQIRNELCAINEKLWQLLKNSK